MTYPRVLAAGQRSQIWIGGPQLAAPELIYETDNVLLEAPNWTLDGKTLVLNGDGGLWTLSLTSPEAGPDRVDLGQLPDLNNDHVLSPDGEHVYLSAMDTHIYRAPLAGGARTAGHARRRHVALPAWRVSRRSAPRLRPDHRHGAARTARHPRSRQLCQHPRRRRGPPRRARVVTRRPAGSTSTPKPSPPRRARPTRPDPRRRRTGRAAADQRHSRLVPPPVP